MRIRMFIIGMLGVAALAIIVTVIISQLIKRKQDRKSFNIVTKISILIIASLSFYAVFQMTDTFLQSKKPHHTEPRMVVLDGKKIKTEANAGERLVLETAYDTIETTHPSVVNMHKKWNGYKYWMAITPYPKGNAEKENPHIFASNDLLNWQVPEGLTNPLDEVHSTEFEDNKRPKQYNSDTHIIYNQKKDQLEMFWRYVDDVDHTFDIYRQTTTDGSNWTPKEVIYTADRQKEDWLSPAFMLENGTYKVWYVDKQFDIGYRESADGLNWTEKKEITVPYADTKKKMHHWHLDVQKFDDTYEMLVVGFEQKGEKPELGERHVMNLYHSVSKDNQTWSPLKPIIYPSQSPTQWDGKGIYRSAMIKEKGKYYVFYSGIGRNDTRGTGIAYGADINNLHGLNYSDTSDFLK